MSNRIPLFGSFLALSNCAYAPDCVADPSESGRRCYEQQQERYRSEEKREKRPTHDDQENPPDYERY